MVAGGTPAPVPAGSWKGHGRTWTFTDGQVAGVRAAGAEPRARSWSRQTRGRRWETALLSGTVEVSQACRHTPLKRFRRG